MLSSFTGFALIVGPRAIMVGWAPWTNMSIAKIFLPVTASSASTRLCGLPRIVKPVALGVT